MYTRLLIPLDGSKTAEAALPYGRTLARTLKIPVELLSIIDIAVLGSQVFRGSGYFEPIVADSARSTEEYLKRIAKTFPDREVECTVEKGKAEDVIIEKAGWDATLTAMARHGRSGFNRLLLGSVGKRCCGAQSIHSYSSAPVKKPRSTGTQSYDL
jgi:nucleotide-binding universal stress UspA family protein